MFTGFWCLTQNFNFKGLNLFDSLKNKYTQGSNTLMIIDGDNS